jgi:uncharacterized membrane protein
MNIMGTQRLEAFSDAVIAIIITIMVLEMKVPEEATIPAIMHVVPVFLSYVLSYVYIGIYWNNHHHLLQATERVSGGILWANLHLLFWLSLIPFTTGWMGENHFAAVPTALYGVVLFMASVAYWILQRIILMKHGQDSLLARALGRDLKGILSLAMYAVAVLSTFFFEWLAEALYVLMALLWLVPDQRIEKALIAERKKHH